MGALLLEQIVIVAGLTAVAALAGSATIAAMRAHGRLVHLRLAEGVEPLGLTLVSRPLGPRAMARGEVHGIQVEARYFEPAPTSTRTEAKIDPHAVLRVELRLPGRMPAGQRVVSQGVAQELLLLVGAADLKLGDEFLDPLLRITSREPEATVELLRDPQVSQALRPCAGNIRVAMDLDGTRLVVRHSEPHWLSTGPTVGAALRLAIALTDAFEAPWELLAQRHGLTFTGRGTEGSRTLAGHVDGVDLKLTLGSDREDEAVAQTRVVASIAPALPGEVRFRGRARGAARSGIVTGDPVIDSVIDVQAVDPEAARALLAAPGVHDLLLEVLHGHPGSYVHPRGVVLVAPGWRREDLEAIVQRAAGLARTLGQAGTTVGA